MCAPCRARRQAQRIVPIAPSAPNTNTTQSQQNSAQAQGDRLRNRLRYTGR